VFQATIRVLCAVARRCNIVDDSSHRYRQIPAMLDATHKPKMKTSVSQPNFSLVTSGKVRRA
jgi:hypothetical protein